MKKERLLTQKEIEEIMPLFLDYQKKKEHYEYINTWSFDVSIPEKAIRNAKKEMEIAFKLLKKKLIRYELFETKYKITLHDEILKHKKFNPVNYADFKKFITNA